MTVLLISINTIYVTVQLRCAFQPLTAALLAKGLGCKANGFTLRMLYKAGSGHWFRQDSGIQTGKPAGSHRDHPLMERCGSV